MNWADLTILVTATTFIVMLIILARIHEQQRSINLLLNIMIKKLNAVEEKMKWDLGNIKAKLDKPAASQQQNPPR
jgi:hypothetical protein